MDMPTIIIDSLGRKLELRGPMSRAEQEQIIKVRKDRHGHRCRDRQAAGANPVSARPTVRAGRPERTTQSERSGRARAA